MVIPGVLEPPTCWLEVSCSIQLSYGTILTVRQVVPVFTRFVQMPFAHDARLIRSKANPIQGQPKATNHPAQDAYLYNGYENDCGLCLLSIGPGTIAGKGKIISIGTRLDAP